MTKSYWVLLLLILGLAFFGAPVQAKKTADLPNEVLVGKVPVVLAAPEGLTRVDGQDRAVDEYVKSLEPKFKLTVLALYAEPVAWKNFTTEVAARRPASIPRLAMICVPAKMPKKSFTTVAMRQEQRRYANWFSLAANNRPMAALLTSQGNAKLKEKLGVDLDFQFKTDDFTQKFAETSNSISFGSQVSFNVFGQVSKVFLTTTSLGVDDKMVYLAYFEESGSADKLRSIQSRTLAWRDEVSGRNAR